MTEEKGLLDKVTARLSDHRSYREAEKIAGSMWANDYKLFLAVLIEVILTIAAIYLIDRELKSHLVVCPLRCNPLAPEPCCGWSTIALTRFIVMGLTTFAAALIGTLLSQKLTFARSAGASAIVLIIVASILLLQGTAITMIFVAALTILLSSFAGYRVGLRLRK